MNIEYKSHCEQSEVIHVTLGMDSHVVVSNPPAGGSTLLLAMSGIEYRIKNREYRIENIEYGILDS
mgnify:CR=1 FL=1